MKKLREILSEETKEQRLARIRGTAADFGKEVDFQKQKLETKPTPLPKSTGVEKIDSNDILSGSRHGDGIVTDQDKSTRQIQKQLRKDYQQPPGFGTPSYDKARDKMDIEFKKNLPELPDSNVPAEAVPGSIRPQYTNPMKTAPAVPVPVPKPKAKPAEIDQRVPRPKLRPEKTPAITNKDNTKGAVAIPEPKSVGIDVKPSDKKAASDQSTRKIQKGDTFWDIADGNPEEVKRLKKLNPNINPSKLQIGQEIKLK